MTKKIKNKNKMTKKINIKTKKSQSKKSQSKIFQKKRSHRQKSINRFHGGAFQVPLVQVPVQGQSRDKYALFFDNDEKNFVKKNIFCPNIINIKVNDNVFNTYDYNIVLEEVNKILPPDPLDTTKYTKFIINNPNFLIHFDGKSGIPTDNLNRLFTFFNENPNSVLITDIILDFDRTFTMCEGLFRTDYLSGQSKLLTLKHDKDTSNIQVNEAVTTPQDNDPETMNLLILIMGGLDRIKAMKTLLEIWLRKNIMITILTNNDLPLSKPHLIPDIIRLVLDIPNLNGLNIQIFSTHQTLGKNHSVNLRKQFKYETLKNKGLCNNFDSHINPILNPELIIVN